VHLQRRWPQPCAYVACRPSDTELNPHGYCAMGAQGAPVQVNVVGTLTFVLALTAVGAGQLLRRRHRAR
jgi:hypothetical protein